MNNPSKKVEKLRKSKALSGVGKLGAFGFVTDAGYNMMTGDDIGTSVMKAGVTGALFASNPILMSGITMGSAAAEVGWGMAKFNMQKKMEWNSHYAYSNRVGGNYMDTQRAQTMRQAAVQAIQGSKLNARSALGGEAKILSPYSTRY